LRQVLQLGIIVIIVLFQPELRKLFEQMGASRFDFIFKKRGRFENVEAGVNNVVAASQEMIKNETGAIIVFERDIGLNDYVATGTRVDAYITSELIQNIFFHNSPLHDGAVIVRDGRLLAAACMLPLSNNINLSRDLGMRHRAGVGISERSDAVAIIVSEQSGTVSVAIGGMLKRHLTKDTFAMLLKNELVTANTKRKKSKKAGKPRVHKARPQKEPKEGLEK
jgi:diadenylate cyclase